MIPHVKYDDFRGDYARLSGAFGIVLPGVQGYVEPSWKRSASLAMDAQPTLITVANNGIPAYLTNTIDPEVIRVLTTPNDAAEIYGETQKGSWVTRTMTFTMVEATGEVASYGDWDNNGSAGFNAAFPQRQSYHYQVITQYGDKEVETAGEAKLNYISELDVSAALVLDKFQNNTYFFGVAGLQNYGALNDPSLPPSIVPTTKGLGGTTWDVATAEEIFADFAKLINNAIVRGKGQFDRKSVMTIGLSPGREGLMTKTNSFGINVGDLLAKNYPNLTIKTAAQYDTDAGSIIQLRINTVDGRPTSYGGFTEKMRAHGFVRDLSATKQKKSQGTWGCIIRYPIAFSTMIGI